MIYEIIGWGGTLAILLAYLLVSTKKIASDSKEYQMLNLFGAVGIIINSGYHGAIPSVGLNIAWLAISIFALYRIFSKR